MLFRSVPITVFNTDSGLGNRAEAYQVTTKPATGNPTPPVGGDAMCTASTPAPGAGTPACVLDAVTGTTVNWDCGIECGMSGTTNLGGCPMGLTCTMNICQ